MGGYHGWVADCLPASLLAATGARTRWRPTSDGMFTSLRCDNDNDHGGNAMTNAIGATAGDMGRFAVTWHLADFRASKPSPIVCDTGRHGCLTVHIREVTLAHQLVWVTDEHVKRWLCPIVARRLRQVLRRRGAN